MPDQLQEEEEDIYDAVRPYRKDRPETEEKIEKQLLEERISALEDRIDKIESFLVL